MPLLFEWDKRKAEINKKKHNVSFEEASTVFSDALSITIYDPAHSVEEDRFITIGYSINNKLVIEVHADRDKKYVLLTLDQQQNRRENSTKKEINII